MIIIIFLLFSNAIIKIFQMMTFMCDKFLFQSYCTVGGLQAKQLRIQSMSVRSCFSAVNVFENITIKNIAL